MSKSESDQSDLTEFYTATEVRDEEPPWTPVQTDKDEEHDPEDCLNCGDPVTLQFRRVFGDNENRVDGCPNCSAYTDLANGQAKPDRGDGR